MEKRRAAVMIVDVAGFGRMISIDEEGTVRRMLQLRSGTIEPIVASHQGRVIDYTGDGALLVFGDPGKALGCALAMQNAISKAEAEVERQRRFRMRIGLDYGPVMVTSSGVEGLHVVIASRLEALSPHGGICFSDRVQKTAGKQLNGACLYGGHRMLKHLDDPVEVWFWSDDQAGHRLWRSDTVSCRGYRATRVQREPRTRSGEEIISIAGTRRRTGLTEAYS